MEVRNIRWVGIPTTNYEAMLLFLRETMGLRLNSQEPTTAEFSTEANGPVPLFDVDDVHRARVELEAAGVEIVGSPERSRSARWGRSPATSC